MVPLQTAKNSRVLSESGRHEPPPFAEDVRLDTFAL